MRRNVLRRLMVPTTAGLALLAGGLLTVAGAEAGGPRPMGGGAWKGQSGQGSHGSHHHHRGPRVTDTYPNKVFLPRYINPGYPLYPAHPIYPGYPRYPGYGAGYGLYSGYATYPEYGAATAPTYVYVPTYVERTPPMAPAPTSSERQWVPGHWAYRWVPDSGNGTTWVPGYYDRDSVWVAGYYRKTAPGEPGDGSYEPYWVEGYWYP